MKTIQGVLTLSATELVPLLKQVKLVDVRRPDEFTGELGHIPGAELVTLGPDLVRFLEQQNKETEMVFICRSGVRSHEACLLSQRLGFSKPMNLEGGMIHWNEHQLPTEKSR